MSKLKAWKEGMENKGLRVNIKKTKLMITGPGLNILRDSGAFPCAVCQSDVGVQTMQSSARNALSECKRSAAVSRADLLQTQTMFAQGVVDKLIQLMAAQMHKKM